MPEKADVTFLTSEGEAKLLGVARGTIHYRILRGQLVPDAWAINGRGARRMPLFLDRSAGSKATVA